MRMVIVLAAVLILAPGVSNAAPASPDPASDPANSTTIEVFDILAPGERRTVRPDWPRINAQPLGSKLNPVRADQPAGQHAYLARLLCRDGRPPAFGRKGSLSEPGPYGTIIDLYEVECRDRTALVHMDYYHPGYVETRPVAGFQIRSEGGMAMGAEVGPETAETFLSPVLGRLAGSVTPQQFGQIVDAIRASPLLARQLQSLLAERRFGEIRVVAQRSGKPFDGWLEGSAMVFTAAFLDLLAFPAGPTRSPGDLAPNNTVYALAHLAHHLDEGTPDPGRYASAASFVARSLDIEAGAYIAGFNAVMDAALKANGGRPLGDRQVLPFLANPWYRDALGAAQIGPDGKIALTRANIDAVRSRLKTLTRLE